MLLGDFNLHIDDLEVPDAHQLITSMEAFGLKQHITFSTHQLGHTLDLIATESTIQLTYVSIPVAYLSDRRTNTVETNSKRHKEKS